MPKSITIAYAALMAVLLFIAAVAKETREMVRSKALDSVAPHSAITHIPDAKNGTTIDLTTVQGVGPGVPKNETDAAFFRRVVFDARQFSEQLDRGR